MESDMNWEQKALINELIQGMEMARKLKSDLSLTSSLDTKNLLLQQILSSYDKALLILRCNASNSKSQTMHQATQTLSPESSLFVKRGEDIEGDVKGHHEPKQNSKKRKMLMDKVRVKTENGSEGSQEDGYNWRKYGQKDILGSKHPRSYYRCTFRKSKGCWATKQVQRSDEDPTILDISYHGKHTCSQGNNAVLPPNSQDLQEKPHGYNNDDVPQSQPSQESIAKFRNNLTVNTYNLGNEEMACPFTSSSASFGCMTQDNHNLLPHVSYDPFLSSFTHMHLLSPDSDDITRIISASTSTTNSPIFDLDFTLDEVKINSNFPFNASEFFS
ncbi:probable WRKY transcription factor 41 [Lotus japonicus]|uniref:probable WRKY transcription factor 41 n=1 Tax=Lotus japonicus TaxID=34305 RepID=UPI00258B53C6|nr:probable WRKY transcription factor 41 [Lotus japonicus]